MPKFVLKDLEGNVIGEAEMRAGKRAGSEPYAYRYENQWMGWLKRTKSVSTPKVFYALTELMRAGSNEVYVSPRDRMRILSEYGLSGVSYWSAMKELEVEKVILRGDIVDPSTGLVVRELKRGIILLNPMVVWKGKYADRGLAVDEFKAYLEFQKNVEDGENER